MDQEIPQSNGARELCGERGRDDADRAELPESVGIRLRRRRPGGCQDVERHVRARLREDLCVAVSAVLDDLVGFERDSAPRAQRAQDAQRPFHRPEKSPDDDRINRQSAPRGCDTRDRHRAGGAAAPRRGNGGGCPPRPRRAVVAAARGEAAREQRSTPRRGIPPRSMGNSPRWVSRTGAYEPMVRQAPVSGAAQSALDLIEIGNVRL